MSSIIPMAQSFEASLRSNLGPRLRVNQRPLAVCRPKQEPSSSAKMSGFSGFARQRNERPVLAVCRHSRTAARDPQRSEHLHAKDESSNSSQLERSNQSYRWALSSHDARCKHVDDEGSKARALHFFPRPSICDSLRIFAFYLGVPVINQHADAVRRECLDVSSRHFPTSGAYFPQHVRSTHLPARNRREILPGDTMAVPS